MFNKKLDPQVKLVVLFPSSQIIVKLFAELFFNIVQRKHTGHNMIQPNINLLMLIKRCISLAKAWSLSLCHSPRMKYSSGLNPFFRYILAVSYSSELFLKQLSLCKPYFQTQTGVINQTKWN